MNPFPPRYIIKERWLDNDLELVKPDLTWVLLLMVLKIELLLSFDLIKRDIFLSDELILAILLPIPDFDPNNGSMKDAELKELVVIPITEPAD